ncbi:MAG: preprotein translocase subunit SecG [Phycisphaerales bacterium]|mgnify:FL=1|jgi:protein translocase SecG subunit|nr:preprotein translocase subunit SecG [Phycisphaerales bacterium]MBT7170936.1 preprotein translocase subunit SecG [Phycisphaerales bacterium]
MLSFLGILLVIVSLLLIGIVLIQKGRGGGLSGAFGGGSQAFGTRTGDALTWATIVLTVLFLGLTISMTLVARASVPTGDVAPVTAKIVSETKEKSSATIELTSLTLGANIYYTKTKTLNKDGKKNPLKDPTEKSESYDRKKRVKLQTGYTLNARAFRKRWATSEATAISYPVVVEAVEVETDDAEATETTKIVEAAKAEAAKGVEEVKAEAVEATEAAADATSN